MYNTQFLACSSPRSRPKKHAAVHMRMMQKICEEWVGGGGGEERREMRRGRGAEGQGRIEERQRDKGSVRERVGIGVGWVREKRAKWARRRE